MRRMTALRAIRLRCLECSNGSAKDVKECPCDHNEGALEACPLHPYRLGKRPKVKPPQGPTKSIRKYCLWCCSGSSPQVKDCPVEDCPLYRFRFGKNPNYRSRATHRKEKENAEN